MSEKKKWIFKRSEKIRLSQFITTYGPGSMIEIHDFGPAIILDFNNGGLFEDENQNPEKYMISNLGTSRLSKRLKYRAGFQTDEGVLNHSQKIGIFHLPSNAVYDREISDEKVIYNVKKFPLWSLCNNEIHTDPEDDDDPAYAVLHNRLGQCPQCKEKGIKHKSSSSDINTIRFVKICSFGHISDVDWGYYVHNINEQQGKNWRDLCANARDRNNEWYQWIEYGTNQVRIRCPVCLEHCELTDIFLATPKCMASYHPQEFKKNYRPGKDEKVHKSKSSYCNNDAQIIPRNSTSVFIPKVITAILTPIEANDFYKILNSTYMHKFLVSKRNEGEDYPTVDELISHFEEIIEPLEDENESTLMRIETNPNKKAIYQDLIDINKSEIKKVEIIIEKLRIVQESQPDELKNFIRDYFYVLGLDETSLTEEEFRNEEFCNFAGIKTYHYPINKQKLIIDRKNTRKYSDGNIEYEVVPIPKLMLIITQQGYSRISYNDEQEPKIIPTPYIDLDNNNWYPAVELQGEGIFIEFSQLDGDNLQIKGRTEYWKNINKILMKYQKKVELLKNETKSTEIDEEQQKNESRNIIIEIYKNHPDLFNRFSVPKSNEDQIKYFEDFLNFLKRFLYRNLSGLYLSPNAIFLHTFSHLLMKIISNDCGYTLASIRERIYLYQQNNRLRMGILLYSARAGADGSLGGMISLVGKFKSYLNILKKQVNSCSNDPLCGDFDANELKHNGAACYACLFIPETSCEFGNIALDRDLVKNTLLNN